MSEETFAKIVHVWSQAVPDLQSHPDVLTKFIYLVEKIDGLPNIERRFHREGLSFFHAISKNRSIDQLTEILEVFFEGPPISMAATLQDATSQGVSAERMGGVQGQQVMFVKKIGEAEFYGALWPWKDKKDVVTVHLGVCAPGMTEENHQFMYAAMLGHLTEAATEKIDAGGSGRIKDISLSSFLQMSELEKTTCSLAVHAGSRTGTLHLFNGILIDAETGSLKHREAAYAILGWENVEIELQDPSGRQTNEINLPLMRILTEALKQKDESEFATDAAGPEAGADAARDAEQAFDQKPDPEKRTAKDLPAEKDRVGSSEGGRQGEAVSSKAGTARGPGALEKKTGGHLHAPPIGKSNRTLLIAVTVVAAFLAGAAVFWYLKTGRGGSAGEDYAVLMERLESVPDDAEKEKLLNAFIDAHAADPVYTDKAMHRLFDVLNRLESSDFEKASQAVFDLPLDRWYYQKAEQIFDDFLMRHPNSRFRTDISKRLEEIFALTDDAHFGELSELNPRDYLGRLEACNGYLAAHPDGKHRQAAEQFARETLKASLREFSINIDTCKQRKKWDDCLAACRQYREMYQPYMNMAAVDRIEAQVQELKALYILKAETEGADSETVRELYLAFIRNFPDSSERARLEERVAQIDHQQAARAEWMRARATGRDAAQSLAHRIAVLRSYIDQNPSGPYLIEAENLLWKLEQQARTATAAGQGSPTGAASARMVDKGRKEPVGQDNAERLKSLRQKVSASLTSTKGRYVVAQNGTVLDKITGLSWAMLDSLQVTGHCLDYRQAEAWVKQLNDGHHSDWRIPTSAELAGIYQNSPYFPAGSAAWYWSSDVYAKGYQTIAYIVYAKPEAVYRKRTANIRQCGSVRAVRP